MLRRTHVLLTVVMLALASLWSVAPAAAGGPTSVVLSVPGEGRMAALHHTEARYAALGELVGVTDVAGTLAGSQRSHPSGDVVTLTWLVHDIQVWRVDRVHLGAAAGPWVETLQVTGEGSVWDAQAVWHQADRRLTSLLARVLPERGSATDTEGEAASPVGPVPWAVAGLLAGALLTTGLLRLRQGSRPVLLDDRAAAGEQLAWP